MNFVPGPLGGLASWLVSLLSSKSFETYERAETERKHALTFEQWLADEHENGERSPQERPFKISKAGLKLIKDFESFVPFVYDDLKPVRNSAHGYRAWNGEVVKGTLTIGYGHTNAAGAPAIRRGMRITEAEASAMLDVDLDKVEAQVNRLVTAEINQAKFDALVSFQYNTGGLGGSTLLAKLNREDYDGAAAQFDRWNKSKGKVLLGLIRRRDAEERMFRS